MQNSKIKTQVLRQQLARRNVDHKPIISTEELNDKIERSKYHSNGNGKIFLIDGNGNIVISYRSEKLNFEQRELIKTKLQRRL